MATNRFTPQIYLILKAKLFVMSNVFEHFPIQKTARYVHLRSTDKKSTKCLIALHGYGQLATYFSRKFENLCSIMDVVVPEGASRFYVEGTAGRVGASWMTKEDRMTDIADNMSYIQSLVDHLKEYEEIYLLGFSQGGATASRYFAQDARIKGLILWASVFPPDLEETEISTDNRLKLFFLGDQDPYFTPENQKKVLALYANLGFDTYVFNGEHRVEPELLKDTLLKVLS